MQVSNRGHPVSVTHNKPPSLPTICAFKALKYLKGSFSPFNSISELTPINILQAKGVREAGMYSLSIEMVVSTYRVPVNCMMQK